LLKGGGDFGLAPALAKRIISLFEGECSVRNGESGGIVIEIKLPVSGEKS
jgi:K+-sensing histidine kinase KdpD